MQAFVLVGLVGGAYGHAYLTQPQSRNYLASTLGGNDWSAPVETCIQCLNDGGPDPVKAQQEGLGLGSIWQGYPETPELAARHQICGSQPNGNADDYSDSGRLSPLSDSYSSASPTKGMWGHGAYVEGGVISFDIDLTAHHQGHFEFYVCNKDELSPGENTHVDCLNEHRLERDPDDGAVSPVDPNHPERYYVPPLCALPEVHVFPHDLRRVENVRFLLPEDLTCEHCVLQFVYITANTCLPDGYHDGVFPSLEETCPGDMMPSNPADADEWWWKPSQDSCGESYPEEFWNCADICIHPSGEEGGNMCGSSGSTPTAPPPAPTSPPPTPSLPTSPPTLTPPSPSPLPTSPPTTLPPTTPTTSPPSPEQFECPANSFLTRSPGGGTSLPQSFDDCTCDCGFHKEGAECVTSGAPPDDSDYTCPSHSYIASDRWPIQDFTDCACSYGFVAHNGQCYLPTDVTATAAGAVATTNTKAAFHVEFTADVACGQVLSEAQSLVNAVSEALPFASDVFIAGSSCMDPTGHHRQLDEMAAHSNFVTVVAIAEDWPAATQAKRATVVVATALENSGFHPSGVDLEEEEPFPSAADGGDGKDGGMSIIGTAVGAFVGVGLVVGIAAAFVMHRGQPRHQPEGAQEQGLEDGFASLSTPKTTEMCTIDIDQRRSDLF